MNNPDKRLKALFDYDIMDSPPEEAFDDITRLTSVICGTPIALVTLLDLRRQWFKSRVGLEATETPLQQAYCTHAIRDEKVFLVPDAALDVRFASNPLVTGEPRIRFYAGAPLMTPEGVPLGTLCAIDRVPRELSEEQQAALAALARQVISLLELRKAVRDLQVALLEKIAAKNEVATLQELVPMCAWCRKVRDDSSYWQSVEDYFTAKGDVQITHGICPACAERIAPDGSLPR